MPATATHKITAIMALHEMFNVLASGEATDAIADAYEAAYPTRLSPEGDHYTDAAIVRITEDN